MMEGEWGFWGLYPTFRTASSLCIVSSPPEVAGQATRSLYKGELAIDDGEHGETRMSIVDCDVVSLKMLSGRCMCTCVVVVA